MNVVDASGLVRVKIKYRIKEKGKYKNKTKNFKRNTPTDEIKKFMETLPDKSITTFQVTGHGDEDTINIDYTTGDYLSVSDGKLTAGDIDFTNTLKNKLAKDAKIHLKGCCTAKGDNNITKQVSMIFPNASVKGADKDIYGPYDHPIDRLFKGDKSMSIMFNSAPSIYLNGVRQ